MPERDWSWWKKNTILHRSLSQPCEPASSLAEFVGTRLPAGTMRDDGFVRFSRFRNHAEQWAIVAEFESGKDRVICFLHEDTDWLGELPLYAPQDDR